ncbi:MAG: hypothetical protein Kow0079_17930 [Vicingaceae bacterium]|jgi:hypothetical protein
MPGLNQTGPLGQGPMTGRRMGRCTNFGANLKNLSAETNSNQTNENFPENFLGRRLGFGRGRGGRGWEMGRQNRFRGGY